MISEEHDIDHTNYNEAMSNDDAILWQGAIDAKLECIYSNGIWDLVESPIG